MEVRFIGALSCAAAIALAAGMFSGCSGIKPYPDNPERNLQIRTETKSGSAFSRVTAALGVHRVDERCRVEYEGTVDLDQPLMSVGIPAERLSYLVFVFGGSSFLGGSRSTITRETLLRPRRGYRYDVDVSYREDIYNVVIREFGSRGTGPREIEFRGLDACRE